eukprot:gene27872-36716_t
MILLLFIIVNYFFASHLVVSLREFRSYSNRTFCAFDQDPNYPFAYSKYDGQLFENKGRVNSNLQDFRHECYVLGGQRVESTYMSINIPTVSDTSWAVGGAFKHDYGGSSTIVPSAASDMGSIANRRN